MLNLHAGNKYLNYNMATVAKSIGEFSGEDKETHQEWIEAAEVIGELAGVEENELLKMVILGLKGTRKDMGNKCN